MSNSDEEDMSGMRSEWKARSYPACALKETPVGVSSYWRDGTMISGRLTVTNRMFYDVRGDWGERMSYR